MKAKPLWKVSVTTAPEAEDAVAELLVSIFNQPAVTYSDVETGRTEISVYLEKECHLSPAPLPHFVAEREKKAVTPSRTQAARRTKGLRKILSPGSKNAGAGRNAIEVALRDGLGRIKKCGLNIGAGEISLTKVRREDWAESWKRHFKPISIGDILLVKPSWSRLRPRQGQKVVVLDPGLSFGTGQHPTTSFCLEQLARRRRKHELQSLLDVGTGSGILAIAASKLGYRPVDAFDFDPEAVRVARANARQNRVARNLRPFQRDLTKMPVRSPKKYSIICANLISNLLISAQSRLLNRLEPGGALIVAGILEVEFGKVQRAYEKAGLRLVASRVKGEWRSGTFVRRPV